MNVEQTLRAAREHIAKDPYGGNMDMLARIDAALAAPTLKCECRWTNGKHHQECPLYSIDAAPARPFAKGSWQHAVDDALVHSGLNTSESYATPHDAVHALIEWNVRASLESTTSSGSGPLRDGWSMMVGPGHAGFGVYAVMDAHPDKGALCLAVIDPKDYADAAACKPFTWNGTKDRTKQDYAVEHAEYMAVGAEHLLTALNAEDAARMVHDEEGENEDALSDAEDARSEAMRALRGYIYEFRKRRDRAKAAVPYDEWKNLLREHRGGPENQND